MKSKNIVFGITGGIASYKSVELVRLLRNAGYNVEVVMTKNATKFVAPLTFQTMSKNRVIVDMFDDSDTSDIQHIALAQNAKLVVVAPATANIIGKVANGIADDMLSTTIMATTAPVLFVPAMNFVMYASKIVQLNIKKLTELGFHFMEPEVGPMATGIIGKGRMPQTNLILEKIFDFLK